MLWKVTVPERGRVAKEEEILELLLLIVELLLLILRRERMRIHRELRERRGALLLQLLKVSVECPGVVLEEVHVRHAHCHLLLLLHNKSTNRHLNERLREQAYPLLWLLH